MNKTQSLFLTGAAVLTLCGCSAFKGADQTQVDLTTPEATVVSFTKAAAGGRADLAMKCVHPKGHDYQDIRDVLTATPGSEEYEARMMFEAVDANVAMPIVRVAEEAGRVAVTWRVTFKRGFEVEGVTIEKGETYDFDANLQKSGDQWLIYGL